MHRSHLLRWLALSVAVLSVQCLQSLSDDCTKTRTCEPAPQLGADCRWYYPDGGIWEEGPRLVNGQWLWPNGQRTATQKFVCPTPDGALGDAGLIGLPGSNCPTIPCDEGTMCDEATHRCVRCQDDAQCTGVADSRGALPVCDTRIRDCVVCLQDADCNQEQGLHCKRDEANPRNNRCVECADTRQCTTDGEICDSNTDKCTPSCSGPGECKGTKSICSGVPSGICVQCIDDHTCAAPTPQCNTARKECVPCVDNAPCGAQVCNSANRCVDCVDDSTCAPGTHCDTATNKCVACVNDSQCTAPEASRCNAQHQCAPCNDNSQCESGRPICDPAKGGLCVECVDDSTCGNGACDVPNGKCVGCVESNDCNHDPTLARCDTAAHQCAPCSSTSQCVGKFPGNKNICRNPQSAGECVECTANIDCSGDPARSKCNLSPGVCTACAADLDCGAVNGKHACLTTGAAHCVECTNASHCVGNANGLACNTATNTCVQCVADTDCTAPGASRCVNNQCVACVNDAGGGHCAHIVSGQTALAVCDTSGGAGVCVQCTGKDRTACGSTVCNSTTKVCSPFAVGSAGLCEDCVSDAHCGTNLRCLQETFEGALVPNSFSCFPLDSANACPQTPFSGLATATTIDGDSEAVCLLRQTTCAGFNQANNKPCSAAADCGEPSLNDGICDIPDGEVTGTCRLPCASGIDCPSGSNTSCLGGFCVP